MLPDKFDLSILELRLAAQALLARGGLWLAQTIDMHERTKQIMNHDDTINGAVAAALASGASTVNVTVYPAHNEETVDLLKRIVDMLDDEDVYDPTAPECIVGGSEEKGYVVSGTEGGIDGVKSIYWKESAVYAVDGAEKGACVSAAQDLCINPVLIALANLVTERGSDDVEGMPGVGKTTLLRAWPALLNQLQTQAATIQQLTAERDAAVKAHYYETEGRKQDREILNAYKHDCEQNEETIDTLTAQNLEYEKVVKLQLQELTSLRDALAEMTKRRDEAQKRNLPCWKHAMEAQARAEYAAGGAVRHSGLRASMYMQRNMLCFGVPGDSQPIALCDLPTAFGGNWQVWAE